MIPNIRLTHAADAPSTGGSLRQTKFNHRTCSKRSRAMLRAKKPEAVNKRLKLFMYGPAGVGKTTAAIQFPNSYIIDCERGAENYDKLIAASNSVVFQTTDIHEVMQEIRGLLTVQHDYRTLVIDPITTIYNDLLEKCEA